jgi:Ca2+-transporting ATPase
MAGPGGPVPLDPKAIREAEHAMAGDGLRVLAAARAIEPPFDAVDWQPSGLEFLGLIGMMDPPRQGVRDAVAATHSAGISVIMVTGDHAATARSIGAQLGIAPHDAPVVTGADLRASPDRLQSAIDEGVRIFARVEPTHKLEIVQELQRRGEVVAVTGDGINDAPALRAADVGVAMGRDGTDVAREAADVVLADDNYVTIVAAVEEGRITFDNLRKVTFFLISTGAAGIVAILATLAMGLPLIMLPAQLLWLNLVTNGLQDVALAFEPGEKGVLKRKPRPRNEGIVSRLLWERTAVAGLVMAAGTVWIFQYELAIGASLDVARTAALTTMVLFQIFHVGNARSDTQSVFRLNPFANPFLLLASAAAFLIHVAALYLPFTQFILRVEPLNMETWFLMVLVALTIVLVMELHKLVRNRWPVG